MSEVLHDMMIVIGAETDYLYINTLFDSVYIPNMGRRKYHNLIRDLLPDLVVIYVDFFQSNYELIVIADLDSQK